MNPPSEKEQITRAVQSRLRQAARGIGDPAQQCSSMDKLTFEQVEGYAAGVKHTLLGILEDAGLSDLKIYEQIDGALGERFRRLFPDKPFTKSRKLNNILNRIRDLRIGMLDRYELLDYNAGFCPLRQAVFKLERQEGTWDLEDFNRAQHEIGALWSLYRELVADREWIAEHCKRRELQKAA